MREFLASLPSSPEAELARRRVEESADSFSPVLGRWRSEITPRSNIFLWLPWEAERIGAALTAMCLPFFRLRAWEFDEKRPGKHLRDLNLRYNTVSMFVATSLLAACVASKKQGIAAAEHWLDVAANLRERHNYHMLFAVQNALQKHQVDRVKFLTKSVSRRHAKFRKEMDALFDATDRMRQVKAEVAAVAAAKQPLIPCVFWLVQKAALLQESPVRTGEGALNTQRVAAAVNIFADLASMQETKYSSLREDEQMLWYLMRLERDEMASEEDLYRLSDAAIKLGARFQVGGSLSKKKMSVDAAAATATDPRKKGVSLDLPKVRKASKDKERDSSGEQLSDETEGGGGGASGEGRT